MLGDDIAAALPELRAHAESLMRDRCVITDPTTAERAWDAATGTYGPASPVTVYAGQCRVQRGLGGTSDAQAGGATWGVNAVSVQLPITPESSMVRRGHVVRIVDIDPLTDADLLEMQATVRAVPSKTHAVKRTLLCEEVA